MTWTIKGALNVFCSVKGKGETRLAPEVLQTRLKTWDSLFPRNIKLAGVIGLRVSLYRLPCLIWNCASNKMLNWDRMLCFGSNGARCLFIVAVFFGLLLFHTGGGFPPFTKMSSTSIPQEPHWGREPRLQPPPKKFASQSWACPVHPLVAGQQRHPGAFQQQKEGPLNAGIGQV